MPYYSPMRNQMSGTQIIDRNSQKRGNSKYTREKNKMFGCVCFALCLLVFTVSSSFSQKVTGTVRDPQNAPIVGATVTLTQEGTTISETVSDESGNYLLDANRSSNLVLTARFAGFAVFSLSLPTGFTEPVSITLQPESPRGNVTVSITRTDSRLSETPASVVVLDRRTLNSTAAQTVDDSLRQIAGFTLFRRSSSKTSNPTTQGANLRGVSGSGASRAAVLFDGLSLNDAFGGWTYWSRVPLVAVEQAELLRGGASSLYGSSGLSGAVNLVPIRSDDGEPVFNVRTSAGMQNTFDAGLFTAYTKNGWGFDLAAETFQTGGHIPTGFDERGLADTNANSRHSNEIFTLSKAFGKEISPPGRGDAENFNSGRIFFRGNLFTERRDNGTSLTNNRTYFRQAAAGADYSNGKFGDFQLRAFLETQVYDQTFSAVSADRNTENLSRLQRVPSQSRGANLLWTRPFGDHSIAASFETREVRGFSDETGYFGGVPTSLSGSGGSERTYSVLVQDSWHVSEKLNFSFGGRFDYWSNLDARSTTRTLATNLVNVLNFADRSQNAFSPRVGALYQLTQNVSVYGAFSRSFRAPTLNELYRGFRVGNVVTRANNNLSAEHANTLEGGVNFTGWKRRLNLRGNVFVTEVSDPVVSITLAATPTLITRQRQNVGATRTLGVELDAEFSIRTDLKLSASYLLADSRVTKFPTNPILIGKFLPQIAKHQLNFQINYRPHSRFSLGIQTRLSDAQFEDDLNKLRLRPYFTMDATAAFRAYKNLEIFTAGENIFNSRYDIGLTPNRTVAGPTFVRFGLRFGLGMR